MADEVTVTTGTGERANGIYAFLRLVATWTDEEFATFERLWHTAAPFDAEKAELHAAITVAMGRRGL